MWSSLLKSPEDVPIGVLNVRDAAGKLYVGWKFAANIVTGQMVFVDEGTVHFGYVQNLSLAGGTAEGAQVDGHVKVIPGEFTAGTVHLESMPKSHVVDPMSRLYVGSSRVTGSSSSDDDWLTSELG